MLFQLFWLKFDNIVRNAMKMKDFAPPPIMPKHVANNPKNFATKWRFL